MQGTVVKVMGVGVIAVLDETCGIGDQLQIFRLEDGVERIIGTGYVRKYLAMGLKINPPDTEEGGRGEQFPDVREGDLVRGV